MAAQRVTGHVLLVKRKRGDQWCFRCRLGDGRQVKRLLGPAWTGNGRPAAGHYTRKMADEALHAVLTDARRGTLAGAVRTGATFADAAAEWLQVRGVRPQAPALHRPGLPELGERLADPRVRRRSSWRPLTRDRIDRWRSRLLAEGRLSARTLNKLLVILHGIFKRAVRVYGTADQPRGRGGAPATATPGTSTCSVRGRGATAASERGQPAGRRDLHGGRVHRPQAWGS